ncbi:metal-dependent hydrolase [Stappia sp.]|jgi:L-ascorbate metabolism protein UlaG (beta-lactamase superfamily)|uniref:metal-dependent hydrolase n=1 Tax=Stappia sp. TaxID=1870903 RepID=UPI003A992ECD
MKLTYLGHSAFRVDIEGASILIDPFLTGNPSFPQDLTVETASQGVTHILLSHGHDDHVGDAFEIAQRTGAQVTANFEICMWLQSKGLENINPMGCGGHIDVGPFSVALTQAHHTSSSLAGGMPPVYLGQPNGLIVHAKGEPTLYHMGDTDVFGDMALVNELHAPKVAIVPIGDRFTMGAKSAALACRRFFDFDTIIPCHYGTFPILDQSADAFLQEMGGDAGKVRVTAPGSSLTV